MGRPDYDEEAESIEGEEPVDDCGTNLGWITYG